MVEPAIECNQINEDNEVDLQQQAVKALTDLNYLSGKLTFRYCCSKSKS